MVALTEQQYSVISQVIQHTYGLCKRFLPEFASSFVVSMLKYFTVAVFQQ